MCLKINYTFKITATSSRGQWVKAVSHLALCHSEAGKHGGHHTESHAQDDDWAKQAPVKRVQITGTLSLRWRPGFAADVDTRGGWRLRDQGICVDIEKHGKAMGQTHIIQCCDVGLVGKYI